MEVYGYFSIFQRAIFYFYESQTGKDHMLTYDVHNREANGQ